MGQVHCGICEIGLLYRYHKETKQNKAMYKSNLIYDVVHGGAYRRWPVELW